ncbi:MAG: bifunctional precorrin-2 dehydrogenase/sirohydrochlorin ferrochelatase [Pirellulaceae bacterium]|nr:bifunctional precorrin-2 dehydrogenase/sirohydrochlorin ferrochelatase [Pirellulaceae bacterium]
MSVYPIMLKVRGRMAVVVGGGPVAMRKIRSLKKAGARITVVAEDFADETDLTNVEVIRRSYQAKFLEVANIVFACTNDQALNTRIATDARRLGALVNCVDQSADCDFYVPAIVSRGDVIVAIGTGGAAPALAAELKKQIDRILPDQIGEFTRALAKMRKQLQTEVADIQQRSEIMKKLSNHASYEAFCRNGESALAQICRELISQGLP